MHARLEVARRELPRAVRIALAAGVAWWISRLLGADRPVFAVIVPMVAIRDDAHAALSLSLGRMLGVIAGVVLGIVAVALFGVSTAAIALLLIVGLAIGLFLRTGPELNTQIAISAVLVLVATTNTDTYAVQRIWETGVGSVVSLFVAAFVLPPNPLADSLRRLAESARALAADLADARGVLTSGNPTPRVLLARSDAHARAAGKAVEELPMAQRALRFSPLRRSSRPRLAVVDRRQRLALRLATQVRRLARDLVSFAGREDRLGEWQQAQRSLPPIIDVVAAGAAKALAGEGCSHEVQQARELLAAYQAADTRPIAAILRRPLVLLVDELAGPPA